MEAFNVYEWLMHGSDHSACDRFDAHVIASVLSVALLESAAEGTSLTASLGLESSALDALLTEMFPRARELFARLETNDPLVMGEDEACLCALLIRCSTNGTPFQDHLARMVARRALRPNHLWQDLGLRNRRELSWLMERHFEWLSSRNANDMKWKKFLYRTICRDGSFPICTAPSCAECCDFEDCFGDETGETLLAKARREAESLGVRSRSIDAVSGEQRHALDQRVHPGPGS